MRYFDEGKRDAFFSAWQMYVPASQLLVDLETQKLEFVMQVFTCMPPFI